MEKLAISGQCHCNSIQFEAKVDPQRVRICHCNDCQIISGSAFRINLPTRAQDFKLTSGELKTYIKTAESRNKRALCFCETCGTQIYSTSVDAPSEFNLRVGTINERKKLIPQSEQWESEAMPWTKNILSACQLC